DGFAVARFGDVAEQHRRGGSEWRRRRRREVDGEMRRLAAPDSSDRRRIGDGGRVRRGQTVLDDDAATLFERRHILQLRYQPPALDPGRVVERSEGELR